MRRLTVRSIGVAAGRGGRARHRGGHRRFGRIAVWCRGSATSRRGRGARREAPPGRLSTGRRPNALARLGLTGPRAEEILTTAGLVGRTTSPRPAPRTSCGRWPAAPTPTSRCARWTGSRARTRASGRSATPRCARDVVLRGRLFALLGGSTALGDHLVAHPDRWRRLTADAPDRVHGRRHPHRDTADGRRRRSRRPARGRRRGQRRGVTGRRGRPRAAHRLPRRDARARRRRPRRRQRAVAAGPPARGRRRAARGPGHRGAAGGAGRGARRGGDTAATRPARRHRHGQDAAARS